jgi:hypothetical protein
MLLMKKKALILAGILCMLALAGSFAADPGSEGDPLVTRSYVESVVVPQTKFQVVTVSAGKSVICDGGTEMILRMGTCSVIGTQKGGVSDVTMGFDLADGIVVQGNHLLVVPLDDGRGVRTSTDCILMIKGGYRIQ